MSVQEDLENPQFHKITEDIVDMLERTTNNFVSRSFYRLVVNFCNAQIATNMRVTFSGKMFDRIPVNMYGCGLMQSGAGKGNSMGFLEKKIYKDFRDAFLYVVMPQVTTKTLAELAAKEDILTNAGLDRCLEELNKEYVSYGPYQYNFDSGTGPAFKQMRNKTQMCGCGALTYVCDEIGSNLMANDEINKICLETYDTGTTKGKITKNTEGNKRQKERDIDIPTNILWYGTPSKLLNSGPEENYFFSILEEGMGRRMFFGEGNSTQDTDVDVDTLYASLTSNSNTNSMSVTQISNRFTALANPSLVGLNLDINEPEEKYLLEYRLYCAKRAKDFPSHETIKIAEMQHRYWKVVKLAGAYAFIDGFRNITKEHLLNAMCFAEESGKAFYRLLQREKPYEKLAKYLIEVKEAKTQADLQNELPFFNTTKEKRRDMLTLASEWAYQHDASIQSYVQNKIEFVYGAKLEKTDLDNIVLSISKTDITTGYVNATIKWSEICNIGRSTSNWTVHHLKRNPKYPTVDTGYRADEYVIPGFNLVVLDLDGGVSLESVKDVLKDYTYYLHTTKRHSKASPRMRVVMPLQYKLYLNTQDFKDFMCNLYESFPFEGIDEGTTDRARKWSCYNVYQPNEFNELGVEFYNSGLVLDPRPFIPNTTQNEQRKDINKTYGNVSSIDRWFLQRTKEGNRNNNLFRYGMMLKDKNFDYPDIERKIIELNNRLSNPLDFTELEHSVLTSIQSKF